MTAYLLDTNHSSGLYRGSASLAAKLRARPADQFVLCLPSIGELWYMIYRSSRVAENAALLHAFLDDYEHFPFDHAAAKSFGQSKAHLRRTGRPIPDIDLQIASIALANDFTVLTADAHFNEIPNLKHENWL